MGKVSWSRFNILGKCNFTLGLLMSLVKLEGVNFQAITYLRQSDNGKITVVPSLFGNVFPV